MNQTPRQKQKEQTRALLLQAARGVFAGQGILNTRMADIAEAAGVSHGTVFLHFKTQEALIAEVVEWVCGKIAARTHELAESSLSLREFLTAHLQGILEFEPFYTRLVIENRLLPPAARDAWITLQSAVSFHFSKIVERKEHAAVPADLLFNLWIGLVHHYLANSDLFAPEGNVIQRYGGMLVEKYVMLVESESRENHSE